MTNEQKIAFVGPKEYSNAMRFVGFECFGVLDKEEATSLIEKIKEENYALILVSQDVCPDDIGLDSVVAVPGMVQKSDPNHLKEEIRKAIGGEINLG